MFKKLQWKLTLMHTLILVSILAVMNVSAYYILQTYNFSQMANELVRMLDELEDSSWLEENEDEAIPETIQISPSQEGLESSSEPEETPNPETTQLPSESGGYDDTDDLDDVDDQDDTDDLNRQTDLDDTDAQDDADDLDDTDAQDDADDLDDTDAQDDADDLDDTDDQDDADDLDDTDDQDDSDNLNDADASDNDETDDLEASWMPEYNTHKPMIHVLNHLLLQFGAITTAVPVGTAATTTPTNPAATPPAALKPSQETSESLHIPSLLKRFTFYLVFDQNGNLVAHNVGNRQTLDTMLALAPEMFVDGPPLIHELSDEPPVRYLLLKRPIHIEGVSQGTYLVGRDLGLVTETMSNLRRILLLSFIVGILASLLAGYLLAGRAIRPIRESYEQKQRFLADASHELRTPISVVLLSTESMERDLLPGQEDARADLADIREETFRMRDLVERLLFLARHDSLKKPSASEQVNLSEVLKTVMSALRILAQSRNISMELRCPEELVCAGDEKMLTSLFTVLVENGIKYNRENGRVILDASMINRKKKAWVEVHVKDTGIGIPETEQKHVFQRFYRADPSRNQKTGGHGLGLAIASEIAAAHGGTIGVISQPEVGTTFTVSLPASQVSPPRRFR